MTQEEVDLAAWLESKKQAPTSLSDGPIGKPNPNAFFTHPYICDICKAMFETEAEAITHIKMDHEEPEPVDLCAFDDACQQ